ncbi:hypothetical protein ACVW00_001406 [Marmoricola sp. URHA0025 HA25]
MFGAALSASLLTVALVIGASASLTRRLWADAPWLAPAYGVLGLGLAAHAAWILCWWSRTACIVFSVAVLVGSAAALALTRFWASWRTWVPLTAMSTSVLGLAVGHTFLWGGLRDPFLAVATRYGAQPGDNVLQYKFAYHLWNNLSTVLFYSDWNGSDRPPLQSGVLLLTRPFETLAGISNSVRYTDVHGMQWGIAASIVAQLIWIPGMYALMRALRVGRGVTMLTIAFVTVLPLGVWNTTYTWPKMMSAGLALSALAILVTLCLERPERLRAPLAAAGALTVLAFLTHGAAAFVVPAILFVALLALRGRGTRELVVNSGLNLGVVGVLYLPWELYSKYADPNYGRLLKWHFAGVIAPDKRPFLPTLVDAYRDTTLGKVLEARRANLNRVFDHRIADRLHPGGSWPDSWRSQDFFSSTFAIGLGTVLLLVWTGVWLVAVARRRPRDPSGHLSAVLVVACFVCMLAWTLVLFLPDGATVHVGTYVWLLVFAAVPFAWTATYSIRLGVLVVILQAAYAGVVYQRPNPRFSDFWTPELNLVPAVVTVVGALGIVAVVAIMVRADQVARRSSLDRALTEAPHTPEPVTS